MSTAAAATVAHETLGEALDRVYARLSRGLGVTPDGTRTESTAAAVSSFHDEHTHEALVRLQSLFALSDFELDVLVLCLGASLEARFASACAAARGDAASPWPSFALALATLDGPHWSALSGSTPLRYWNLIDVIRAGGTADTLLHAPLRVNERILHYVIGVPAIDAQLEATILPLEPAHASAASDAPQDAYGNALEAALRQWLDAHGAQRPLILCGGRAAARESAFAWLCERAGLSPWQLSASELPASAEERNALARLWTREAALQHAALYLRSDGESDEAAAALAGWLARVRAPIALDAPPGSRAERLANLRAGLRVEVPALSADERRAAWLDALGDDAARMNGALERIVDYFHFDEPAIRSAAAIARVSPQDGRDDLGGIAWQICRQQGRRALDNLAQRIEPRAQWDQLVLPPAQTETLRQIEIHLRQRAVVNQRWGFAQRYSRGHGLTALFCGGSGTGKTLAAEILARELDLDLYHIDLAALMSKYIGETEKNLRTVFDAAEESGAVLLFDECDALFGKRSEVRDSHDRYANLEVSYLLQRMDSYRGMAILTTNQRHALDPAFVRRIRFIVQFPLPDAPSRARIWRGIFPAEAPLDEALDFEQLAQLNVPGGVIRNIAVHAAFLAAEAGARIGAPHILAASRTEYAKMDRPLTAAETRGWS
ncbi:MAG TPA: ATP-binding protein [Paraburkholderia sp.]|uniref:ATP-binding protein n=1 Tax=Paraburkholderia sp. TaxID=1926495 RepID=UPI002B5B7C86|nr:ATP-binding protein [Paraburkholderia sp.]HTR10467.1 ATP-binding protein [Paraburkholderia sp.]